MSGFEAFLVLVALGAVCSLDTVSVGQVMVSRPIVSATAGAAVLGRPAEGIVIGAVMELFALETMPFGASRYPEWGSAGVVAGVGYVIGGVGAPGSLAVATLFGLITAAMGSISMVWHRKVVARIAGELRDDLAAGSGQAVAKLHIGGISSDFWRGAMVTLVGLGASVALTSRVLNAWGLGYGPSVAIPVIIALAVGGASLARAVRALPGAAWLLVAGLAVGAGIVGASR